VLQARVSSVSGEGKNSVLQGFGIERRHVVPSARAGGNIAAERQRGLVSCSVEKKKGLWSSRVKDSSLRPKERVADFYSDAIQEKRRYEDMVRLKEGMITLSQQES